MIPTSRIYSFLHKNKRFSFQLIDGQEIISNLAVAHNFTGESLSYLRDTLLSSLLFERLLKVGENLGFYIDSEVPFFKFKLELNHNGKFRTMILPKNLTAIPSQFNGFARLHKMQPNQSQPYTSILEVKNEMTSEIINQFLRKSYQDDSLINISTDSDHSLMVSKLPEITKTDDEDVDSLSLSSFYSQHQEVFSTFFKKPDQDLEQTVKYFEENDFTYLSSKVLSFQCPCSRDHYLNLLKSMNQVSKDELLNDENIAITCDYCRTSYLFDRSEL